MSKESVLESIRSNRGQGVSAFERAVDRLSATRSTAARLIDVLSETAGAAGETGTGNVHAMVEAGDALAEEIDAWTRGFDLVGLKRECAVARGAVGQVFEESRRLAAIASMTEITASALSVEAFFHYLGNLRGMAEALGAESSSVAELLSRLHNEGETTSKRLGSAAATLRAAMDDLRHRTRDGAEEAAALKGGVRRDADAARAQVLEAARSAMGKLIEGVQFSDAFNQRGEHVEQILTGISGPSAVALAAAQLRDLSDDGRGACDRLAKTLSTLSASSRRAVAAFADDASGGARLARAAATERSTLKTAFASYESIAPVVRDARAMAEANARRAGEITKRFDALVASADEIKLSATNAGIAATRTGRASGPLSVLAEAVRESVLTSGAEIRACRGSLVTLQTLFSLESIEAMIATADSFERSIAACRDRRAQNDHAQDCDAEATLRDAADALARECSETAAAIAPIAPVLETLGALARDLGAVSDGAPIDASGLAAALPLYTMERERETHRRLTGESAPAPEADAGAGEDDLDIEFF